MLRCEAEIFFLHMPSEARAVYRYTVYRIYRAKACQNIYTDLSLAFRYFQTIFCNLFQCIYVGIYLKKCPKCSEMRLWMAPF